LGFEVITSPPTNQEILELGLTACVDGACLPLKAFVGHVRFLVNRGLELLFVPQAISVVPGEYTCTNLLGLPDLVQQYIPSSVRLLSPALDARKGAGKISFSYLRCGLEFASALRVLKAWQTAQAAQRQVDTAPKANGSTGRGLNILILGPRYLTDDAYLNADLMGKLAALGVQVTAAAAFPDSITLPASRSLAKRPFWTSMRRSLGALEHCLHRVDGVISLAPFACVAEAMQGVMVAERTAKTECAHLELHVDEHSSPVGLVTRLEAFCDLLERKRRG